VGALRRGSVLVAIAIFAIPAGAAQADVTFRGRTEQGRLMRVVAGDDGIVKRARIWWRAPCARPGFVFRESTSFVMPLDRTVERYFRDAAPPAYRLRDRRGFRFVVSPRISGRKVGPRRWRGTFGVRVVVRKDGRVRDRCAVSGVRWRAVRRR
jgi:hypothetical protein